MTRICIQTALDQGLQLGTQDGVPGPVGEPQQDLGVGLEGDVAGDHVVEEDAQGPDRHPVSGVAPVLDPLRRGVNSGS